MTTTMVNLVKKTDIDRIITRSESVVGLGIGVALLLRSWRKIHWPTFVILFLYIDLIGYIPGLARVYMKRSAVIEPPFYYAYNLTHNFATAIPVALTLTAKYPERRWSALAIFIHLYGDRGLLGNFAKPTGSDFEHYAKNS